MKTIKNILTLTIFALCLPAHSIEGMAYLRSWFSKNQHASQAQINNETQCSICLEQFTAKDAVTSLQCDPNAANGIHTFHKKCLNDAIYSGHEKCPLCQRDIPQEITQPIKQGKIVKKNARLLGISLLSASGSVFAMSLYARTIRKMTGMPFDIPFNAYNLALYTSTGFITAKYTEHLSRLKAVGLIMLATATAMLVLGEVKINGKSQSIMPVLEKITPLVHVFLRS